MQFRRRALTAWRHDLRVGWGERAAATADGVAPLLERAGVTDLHAVGARLAIGGHSLEEVLEWMHLLAQRSRSFRTVLAGGGVATLAAGWADGVLGTDFGTQHVAPLEVLRLRLQQQVALAAGLGRTPGAHLALVVVDTTGADATVALQHARRVFRQGETIAVAPNGKVLVLTPRGADLRAHTLHLTDALHSDERLVGATIRVWIEPLAMGAEHVDSHLLGLAS